MNLSSHGELGTNIVKIQNNFGITCIENSSSKLTPKGKYINISDPEVQVILEREPIYLRTEVLKHIDQKVGIKTD